MQATDKLLFVRDAADGGNCGSDGSNGGVAAGFPLAMPNLAPRAQM